MTIVYPAALVEHVVCFCGFGVAGVVGIDIAADIGEEVGAVARILYLGAEAGEFSSVF